jgi:quercetin dioxygenase-like cupin family protein
MTRAKLFAILIAVAAPIWVAGQASNFFVGGTPSSVDATKIRTTRLKFPKGSRSNWHSHTWGQLLMIEDGKGRTQVRGGPVLEMSPGQPWWTAAGVEHWHGAAPDATAQFFQVSINPPQVYWMEEVGRDDYMGNDIGITSRNEFLRTGVRKKADQPAAAPATSPGR